MLQHCMSHNRLVKKTKTKQQVLNEGEKTQE